MNNTNDEQSDFPEVEALGLTQEVPSLAGADTDDAAAEEWTFKNRRDPSTYEPFPLDVFPPLTLRYIEEKAASCKTDPAPLAMLLLAQAGAHVGQSHLLRLKSDHLVGATLWVAVVAISGSVKSPILRAGSQLIRGIENRWYEEYRQELAKFRRENKKTKSDQSEETSPPEEEPIKKRLTVQNSMTMESLAKNCQAQLKGILVVYDELDAMFNDIGTKSPAPLLSGYNGESVSESRKVANETYVPAARWSIIGCMTPGGFREQMNKGRNAQNGLLARFIVLYPPRIRGDVTADLSPGTKEDFQRVLASLALIPYPVHYDDQDLPQPQLVNLDDAARERYYQWDNEMDNIGGGSDDNTESSFYGKARELLPRVALALHCLYAAENPVTHDLGDCKHGQYDYAEIPGVLTGETMEKAERLTRWLVRETLFVYACLGFIEKPIQLQDDEKTILDALKKYQKDYPDGMTSSDITTAAPRFKRCSQRLKDALKDLIDEKKIKVRSVPCGNNRPANRYSLK